MTTSTTTSASQGYDLVIRNGLVVDGSGAPARRADVACSGRRIVAIGRVDGPTRTEVDAEGHVVAPGFVDVHTHMDAQIHWEPLGSSSCYQGVTSVVMGNCGFTIAPVRAGQRDLVLRNLERAEDLDRAVMEAGIEWGWETFEDYLDMLDRLPKGINYASHIGHSALRTYVMGERAFSESADADDLEAMARHLRRALVSGAVGFSTSRSAHHFTPSGVPVASRRAGWDEIQALVSVVGEHPGAVFELALEQAARSEDADERGEFFARLKGLAVTTGAPITFGVLPGTPSGEDALALLDLLDEIAAAGGKAIGQTHSRGVSGVLSFRTRLPFDALPVWREIRGLAPEAQCALLADPRVCERLVGAADNAEYGAATGAEARRPDFDRLYLLDDTVADLCSVADVARLRSIHPVQLMIDLAVESGLHQLFLQPFSAATPDLFLEIMRHRHTAMTFSDSGAHANQIMDASIQTYLLAYWVRHRQAITLEDAVAMVTSAPAGLFGLADRGLLREGMLADICVFDPERIAPCLPTVAHDLPTGASRLVQRAVGVKATVVGGTVLTLDGEHTGALPGVLIRRGTSP